MQHFYKSEYFLKKHICKSVFMVNISKVNTKIIYLIGNHSSMCIRDFTEDSHYWKAIFVILYKSHS